MNATTVFFNALGIVGSVLLLFGFYRVGIGRWTNRSFWYEFDNVTGAALIIVYQIKYHAFVSVVVNLVWGVMALWGLLTFAHRVSAHRRRVRSSPHTQSDRRRT